MNALNLFIHKVWLSHVNLTSSKSKTRSVSGGIVLKGVKEDQTVRAEQRRCRKKDIVQGNQLFHMLNVKEYKPWRVHEHSIVAQQNRAPKSLAVVLWVYQICAILQNPYIETSMVYLDHV